jgi:hypothetical protein
MEKIPNAPFDAFISLNYLEHLPNPGAIISNIYNNTSRDSVGFVTVPNFAYLLETNCYYEFVADHLSYFTQKTLTHAFEKNGFEVLNCDIINEKNDIAVVVKKREALSISNNFFEVEALIEDLKQIVAKYTTQKKRVAIWGAGHRTLALLALSKIKNIEYVVDSAKFKQGKYTPVLHLNIVSPEHLNDDDIDLILIMVPGLYPGEVIKRIIKMNINADLAVLRGNNIEFI